MAISLLLIIQKVKEFKKNQNFDFPGTLAHKRGPRIKIYQLIWYQGSKSDAQPKFEGPSLKNEKVEILTLRGPGSPKGALKSKFFNWYDIRALWATYNRNLKVLA